MFAKTTKFLLLGVSLTGSLASCSQKENVQPIEVSTADAATGSQVKLVNGRLVFADLASLNQTWDALASLKGDQALAAWENNLHFTSLRVRANEDIKHLEQLDAQGKPAPAYELVTKFGFPTAYTSIINPAGEYQIGDKIYWFHDGFKYQADSEEDLAAIKKDISVAKAKFVAGIKLLDNAELSKLMSRTFVRTDPYSDDRYVSPDFNLNNLSGNKRRFVYGANVYTEDNGNPFNGPYHYYKSAINILVKYDYYSFGNRKWYPVDGQSFTYYADFNSNAACVAPYTTVGPIYNNINESYSLSNGYHAMTLAVTQFSVPQANAFDTNQIFWDLEVSGTIWAQPDLDPSKRYTVTGYAVRGNSLW